MRHINLDHLEALVMIAETGSFTAAARRLNLTQSAVSVQIRELENRLGLPVLDRIGKRAYPTDAGRELIGYATRLLTLSDEAVAAMRHRKDGWLGRIRVGASATVMNYRLPPVLGDLSKRHTTLELQLFGGTTHSICERLLANIIDIGIVTLPVDDVRLKVTPLDREALVAVFPETFATPPVEVTPALFHDLPLLLETGQAHVKIAILAWLRDGGVDHVTPAMALDNIEVIVRMVTAGVGVSIVPESCIAQRSDLVVRPLVPSLQRELGIVELKDRAPSPALDIVRGALLDSRAAMAPQRPRKMLLK